MEKGKEYTVEFKNNKESDYPDEEQIVNLRLIEKDHKILYGSQSHYEAYLRVAVKNVRKDVPVWEKYKSMADWEKVDAMGSADIKKADFRKIFTIRDEDDIPILSDREQKYLSLYITEGLNNKEVCQEMELKHLTTGDRIRKNIIGKLKKWNSRDHDTLADVIYDGIDFREKLSTRPITELRNRLIPLTIEQRYENDIAILNSIQPVIDVDKKGKNYTWLKKKYSGKITAPVVSNAAKIPKGTEWKMPMITDNQNYDVYGIAPDTQSKPEIR